MSEENNDLKSIKVCKFNKTKEGWHEFTLKFRVIADHRGYDDIIEGKQTPPDEKEDLEITDKDDAEVKKSIKDKLIMRATNKKGYRDLVLSTEGISLNIVENSTSDKLTKGDLKKAWGRLERHWNPKTREDKVQFYTKFLHYKLENVKQRPMDWLVFMEKKRNELVNTGHIMDNETFITHLLKSLPQAEYEGAILVIKERLRSRSCDLAEVEQLLEYKYQSMKYVKGWEEEEDDYALFASPAKKKGHKKQFKGWCGYCGEIGHKAANCPDKKSKQKDDSIEKADKKETQKPKKDNKRKDKTDMSKIKCYNCSEMGHFAWDCLKPYKNANIARENEQNRKLAELMDLGDNSVCEECSMICTDAYNDEEYKEMVVYGDQGITSRKFDEDTYGELMNTDSDEEPIVKYNVALCTQGSVSMEKKRRRLNRDIPSELARMMVEKLDSLVMDVETAFLYGDIEEIFMKSPVGMDEIDPGSSPEDCYQLKKGIYGLCQAARQFWRKFVDTKKKEPFGFTVSPVDPCMLFKENNLGICIIIMYVDDMLIIGKKEQIQEFATMIQKEFSVKIQHNLVDYLGCEFNMNKEKTRGWLGQLSVIKSLEQKFGERAMKERLSMTPGTPRFTAEDWRMKKTR